MQEETPRLVIVVPSVPYAPLSKRNVASWDIIMRAQSAAGIGNAFNAKDIYPQLRKVGLSVPPHRHISWHIEHQRLERVG